MELIDIDNIFEKVKYLRDRNLYIIKNNKLHIVTLDYIRTTTKNTLFNVVTSKLDDTFISSGTIALSLIGNIWSVLDNDNFVYENKDYITINDKDIVLALNKNKFEI